MSLSPSRILIATLTAALLTAAFGAALWAAGSSSSADAATQTTVVRVPSVAAITQYRNRLLHAEHAVQVAHGKNLAKARLLLKALQRNPPAGTRVRACAGPSPARASAYVQAVLKALGTRSAKARKRALRAAQAGLPKVRSCGPGTTTTTTTATSTTTASQAAVSPAAGHVGHVWTIVLENENYNATFGPSSPAPYLSKTLPAQGAVLTQYYGTGHHSLDNYLAMISGQGPSTATQADCADPSTMPAGTLNADGQALGTGCTYRANVPTLANQLKTKGVSWKGYMEDMDASPATKRTTCQGPGSVVESPALQGNPKSQDNYAIKHNPFVYFHSITDNQAYCDSHDVPFTQFAGDISAAATTPQFSFIVPNLCNDGHDQPCRGGSPAGGLSQINSWLPGVINQIESSAAYQQDGLILVTFDEAGSDASACCAEPQGANLPDGRTNGGDIPGPGGGRVGAIAISKFIKPGTKSDQPYNHFSYLRTMEDIFGVVGHLGYAARAGLPPLGRDVFSNLPAG